MYNLPNDPVDDLHVATILQGIEAIPLQATPHRVDVLSLTETDPNSIARLQAITAGLYGAGTYEYVVSAIDGGGDSTGFLYDTTTVSLLESIEVPGELTHGVMRGKFRPAGTLGESDFFVYSIHLKSGATNTDESLRASELAVIRQDAESLGASAEILFAGDFNMHSSNEPGWSVITAGGPAGASDAAHAPGVWTGNIAFKALHTHDAQAMRSRFDLHLFSDELWNDSGLDFIEGSFRVFGNNGSQPLGGAVTDGNGGSVPELDALASTSDHLPILSDFEFLPTAPVIFGQSGGITRVTEGGASDSYQIRLGQAPSADVFFQIDPPLDLDLGAGPGTSIQLAFTPTDYASPQTVTVSAVDDGRFERTEIASLAHQITSADPQFQGLSITDIPVTILDNDLPAIVINELDSDTPGADSAEFVELYDGGVGNFALDGLSVILMNGNGDAPYASFDLDGFNSDAQGFFVIGNAGVPHVDLVMSDGTLQNGADAVVLIRGNPTDYPAITLQGVVDAVVYGTNDPPDAGLLTLLLPGSIQVDEDATGNSAVQSLSRMADGGIGRSSLGIAVRPPTPGSWNAPPEIFAGDFDADGDLDSMDVDRLTARIAGDDFSIPFDLNGDGRMGNGDLQVWLTLAGQRNLASHAPYRLGDANLDGAVDGSDFGLWNSHKFTATDAWSRGDFNADGVVDGTDFNLWNANKFTTADATPSRPRRLPVARRDMLDWIWARV